MQRVACLLGSGVLAVMAGVAIAQQSQATVHTVPLVLQDPSRYDIRCELQPVRELIVSAPVSGTVRDVTPKLGDQVRPLSQLVRLEDRLQQIAVNRATAQLAAARAAQDALSDSATAPQRAAAEAAVKIAEADKDEAEYWLGRTTVTSPIEGQVTELRVLAGQYVAQGQSLLTITDYQSVVVWMPWDAQDAQRGKRITVSIEGQKHTGAIQAVVPVIPAHRRLLALRGRLATAVIEIENRKGQLRPGQTVACTLLPLGPLARIDKRHIRGNNVVYVLRGDVVRHIEVRKHATIGKDYLDVSGSFQEGDELITSTSRAVADGTQIDPKNVRRSS